MKAFPATLLRRFQSTNLAATLGWALFSALISQFLNVVNSVFLGRILQAENFGAYNLVLMTVAVACSLGSCGLGVTATRFVANERGQGGGKLRPLVRYMVLTALMTSVAASLVFFVLTGLITHHLVKDVSLHTAYQIASLYVVGFSVDLVLMGILMGFEQFRSLALTGMLKGLFAIVACGALASSMGVKGAVLGISAMTLFGASLNGVLVARTVARLPQGPERLDIAERQHVLRFSFPIMLASLLVNPSVWLSSVMVSQVHSGNRLLAEFAVVRNWMIILQFFPLQIAQALLPFLSRKAATVSHRTSLLPLTVVTGVALMIALLTYPLGLWFVHLYGFRSASLTVSLTLVVIGSVVSAINTMAGQMLLSEGHAWPRFVVDVVIALALLLTVYVFIHVLHHSELALSAGTTLSLAVGALCISLAQLLYRKKAFAR